MRSTVNLEQANITVTDKCLSTHGACGYAPGSYVKPNGMVVCGICGEEFPVQDHSVGRWMNDMRSNPKYDITKRWWEFWK